MVATRGVLHARDVTSTTEDPSCTLVADEDGPARGGMWVDPEDVPRYPAGEELAGADRLGREIGVDEVTGTIAALLDLEHARVIPERRLSELVTDSFTLVQLAMDIQDEFDVVLYSEDLACIEDVGDLIELLRERA